MRSDVVAGGFQVLHHFAFEGRLQALFFFIEGAHQAAGILGVLDKQAAEVLGLKVVVGAERMDHPHLIARAAGGNVETLLEKLLVAHGKRAALRGIHKRDEDDVALVALELCGVAAKQAVKLVAIRRDTSAQ